MRRNLRQAWMAWMALDLRGETELAGSARVLALEVFRVCIRCRIEWPFPTCVLCSTPDRVRAVCSWG